MVIRKASLFDKDRISRNLFSSFKSQRSVSAYSDEQQTDKELNDRVAERFFVKRTKRSYDLTVVSKRNYMVHALNDLKRTAAKFNQMMTRGKGQDEKPVFFLGPKMPSSPEDGNKFAAPSAKAYVCEYCKVKLFNVTAYVKHLRKHKLSIRCSGCSQSFNSVFNKRRHELGCSKKSKLRF